MESSHIEVEVLKMFRGCTTKGELAAALAVALSDKGATSAKVNEIYHRALGEKGWR